jgi:hypothetical protein
MLRSFVAVLCFAAVALSQPLAGPWTFLGIPASMRFTNPHVLPRDANTADIFYQIADTVYHATVGLQNGHLLAGPQAFTMDGVYSRRLCDVAWTGSDWTAVVDDTTDSYNRTTLFHGLDTLTSVMAVDSGISWPTGIPYIGSSRNEGLRLTSDGAGNVWLSWLDYWDVLNGQFEEGGIDLTARYFSAAHPEGVPMEDFSGISEPTSTVLRNINADSALAAVGFSSGMSFWLVPSSGESVQPQRLWDFSCEGLMDFVLTHRHSILALSDLGNGHLRILDPSDETCTGFSLSRLPYTSASHPDYGMAWLSYPEPDLDLFRVDTAGAYHLSSGTLIRSRGQDYQIADADLAITESGKLVALWVEWGLHDTATTQLRIATIGFDTPLSITDPRAVLQPSSIAVSCSPNPFNSTLDIRYELPRAERIELAVFNVLGQKVATLFDGMKDTGAHRELWSPKSAGGVYLVRLQSAEATRTTKVLYLK